MRPVVVKTRHQGSRPRLLPAALAGLFLVGAFGSFYALWPTPREIERRFVERSGFDPRLAFPARDDDLAARRISALAEDLWRTASRARRTALAEHERELRRTQASPDLPPVVADWLDEEGDLLAKTVETLAAAPRFERDLDLDPEAPPGDWSRPHLLHRVLLATVAREERLGRHDAAQEKLAAAWRLRQAYEDGAMPIDQLYVRVFLRDELILLRAMEEPPPGWRRRLAPLPLRHAALAAVGAELWRFPDGLERWGPEGFFTPETMPSPWLRRLQARRGLEGLLAAAARTLRRLDDETLRPSEVRSIVAAERSRIARWNVMARRFPMPDVAAEWARAANAELDLELARLVLATREALAGGDAQAIEGRDRPSVVAGVAWRHEVAPEAVTIRAVGDLPWAPGTMAPLVYRWAWRQSTPDTPEVASLR